MFKEDLILTLQEIFEFLCDNCGYHIFFNIYIYKEDLISTLQNIFEFLCDNWGLNSISCVTCLTNHISNN